MGRSHMRYPLVPEQILSPSPYRRGQPTGMVFCPRRVSDIATMRCAEYQQRDHCAKGCPNAAKAEETAELREAMTRHYDIDGNLAKTRGTGFGRSNVKIRLCVSCGREKKSKTGDRCRHCGQRGKRKGGKARAAQMRSRKK